MPMQNKSSALIIVDVQNDFVEGGSLAVSGGKAIVPIINKLMPMFETVIATQDWHPQNHCSFAVNHGKSVGEVININGQKQVLWPVHCLQNSYGAQLVEELNQSAITHFQRKGEQADMDSYSAFFDNAGQNPTGLEKYLKTAQVNSLYVCGIALDYCVKYTCLDAISLGFDTRLITDANASVSVKDGYIAIKEIQAAGVKLVSSNELLA